MPNYAQIDQETSSPAHTANLVTLLRPDPFKSSGFVGEKPEVELIYQSSCDEKLETISSLNILQFAIHSCDCIKSTTQKSDPEILMEA